SVQIEQNWLYRLLNVYLVKIDTIGEDALEVEIGGVWEPEALELKNKIQNIKKKVLDHDSTQEIIHESEPAIDFSYTLTSSQVSRYAFTENLLWFLLPLSLSIVLIYRIYHSAEVEQLTWSLVFDLVFGNFDPSEST